MLIRARSAAVLACTIALAANTACYAYQPSTTATPTPQSRVRVRLTPEGTRELARYLGPRVETVDGTFTGTAPDGAMTVAVDWVQLSTGARQAWNGEGTVTIPAAYVTGVQQRTLQRGPTIFAALALAGALVAISAIALNTGGSQGGGDGGGGGPPP